MASMTAIHPVGQAAVPHPFPHKQPVDTSNAPEDDLSKPSYPANTTPSSSREASPSSGPVSDQVNSFFNSVSPKGFPEPKFESKVQPWRRVWIEPQGPSEDGKLVVTCPKKCVYGSNNLGGL